MGNFDLAAIGYKEETFNSKKLGNKKWIETGNLEDLSTKGSF